MARPTFLLCIALLGLVACGPTDAGKPAAGSGPGTGAPPRQPDPIAVSAAAVLREPMASVYKTSGTLRSNRRATATSRTRGVIEQLLVEEGDVVQPGQVLAQLERAEQLLAVDRYEMTFSIKQREFERSRSLQEEELVSSAELELIRQQVEELQHDLDLARLNLERTTITAPFGGIVVQRHLDLGATVSDGTALFDLADVDPLYVDVSVPERHVARLAAGQTVQLYADAVAISARAAIERLAPVVDTATGTVKVTVSVDPTVALRPGAFVEIEVVTDVRPQALVVPRSALVAEGRRWLIYRLADSGDSVQALEVVLGFEQGQRVEIAALSKGGELAAGDRVIVRGASALSDGARVLVVPDPQSQPPKSPEAEGLDDEAAARSEASGTDGATVGGAG